MGLYTSEIQKIRPLIQKYLVGKTILDIGCNNDPITPEAITVDCNPKSKAKVIIEPDQIYKLSEYFKGNKFSVICSSHSLEHILFDMEALWDWSKLLKDDGRIILYLPDIRYYREYNPEHFHNYTLESFVKKLNYYLPKLEIVEKFMHIEPECYSFCVVLKKQAI